MKLIEALKLIASLEKKANDLAAKAQRHCAISNFTTPEYGDKQRATVDGWIQAHRDIVKEIMRLSIAIQRTNLETMVPILLAVSNSTIEHSIAEWILRRRKLAAMELALWAGIGDRGIQEGPARAPDGDATKVTITRFYDPNERDKMMEEYTSERAAIDSRLEVINAVTDLIEA